MDFSEQEVTDITAVANQFNQGTQISVVKIVAGTPYFYGVERCEGGAVYKQNQSAVFEIGSLTKVFTGYLLAELIVAGEIKLDQDINAFLPKPLGDKQTITFRQLATHTSGLPRLPPGLLWRALFKDKENPYQSYDEYRLIDDLVNKVKIKSTPRFAYSNLGMGLLGYVISRIHGLSFEAVLNQRIAQRFNMTDTTCRRELVSNHLVEGLNVKGHPTAYWDLGALEGAGAVMSSCADMANFALANFNAENPVMKLQQSTAYEKGANCLGLAWVILDKAKPGKRMHFHNGGTGGFSAAMLLDTQGANGVIALSNVSGLHKLKGQKIDGLVFRLMQMIKEK